ncbi:DUF7927 domain-containing protein [Amycolatopsis samaneae]|uniref:GEVED domain-containing protein n=1 Tax=Amycolatopsis samaneae TaxID=664691 RepID=A0ABW5GW49_9PSEU
MSVRPGRRFAAAVVAVLLALADFAVLAGVAAPPADAYQTHPAGSWFGNTGTNTSAASTLPSGLQVTVGVQSNLQINRLSGNNADSKGLMPGMYTPAIPGSTPFAVLGTRPDLQGCYDAYLCPNMATLTVSFNRPVRNPVLHLAGIGAFNGYGKSQVRHTLTGSSPAGASLSLSSGTNLQVSGGRTIEVANRTSNTVCSAASPGGGTAGCGSVQVSGTVSSLTFAVDQTGDGFAAITTDEYLFGVSADENFGDAPASYDAGTAASHIVGDLRLGQRVDPNNTTVLNTGQVSPSPNAVAPGADITSAHTDGVAKPLPRLTVADVGRTYSVTTALSGASAPGQVCGWIDFNRNGVFDNPGERACANFAAGATSATLNWTVPSTIVPGYTYLRLRAGYTATQVQNPTGLADSGEVEDYRLPIEAVAFEKKADKQVANPGDKVTYTVTATNSGPVTVGGVRFQDELSNVLDDATYNNDQRATSGTVSYTQPTLSWVGDLAPGQTVTVTYSVTVKNPATGDHQLVNGIRSNAGNCVTGSADPKCSTTVNVSGLDIAKTADKQSANPGDTVKYTVTVRNTGRTALTGATFTDDLSKVVDDATFNTGSVTASAGSASYSAPRLTWTGDLPVGATATITYTVTVKNPVTGDFKLVNAITSTTPGSNCAAGSADPKCTTTTPVSGLKIQKKADRQSANPGDKVTYTVTVTNTGQTPQNGATFTDDLSKVVDDADYNNDAATSAGTTSYTAPKLTWTGNLPVGGSATVTYSVTVKNPATGDHKLVNAITSTTPGSNCAAGSTDPACSTTTPVAGIEIAKTVDKSDAKPGDTVTYTVTVRNTGQTPQNGATFTDDLSKVVDDATLDTGSITASTGSATYSAPKLTWTGDLPVGGTATVSYAVKVNNPDTGDHKLVNAVTSATPGSNCVAGSTDPKCTTTTPVSGLKIQKKADKEQANPGDKVTYTVTVTNTGQTPQNGATFTDDLSKVVDDATYGNDASATVGSTSYAAPKLTWTGDLPVGASATITYSVTVKNPATGDHKLVNAITSTTPGNNCAAGSTDPACSTTTPVAGIELSKTADRTSANPGDTVRYTVTVRNTGQTPLTGATFTDDLSKVIDDATFDTGSISASTGTAGYTAPKLTWTGDLGVGATATVTYTVKVKNPVTGDHRLVNAITSTTPGNNCAAGSADPKCTTATPVSGLRIDKSVDRTQVVPGDKVTYTITVTNTGQTPQNGATFTDDLSNVVDDATYGNDASATVGSTSYAAPKLTWTGDLPVGGTATVKYSVTVKNPDPGDKKLNNVVTSGTPGNNCPPGATDPSCSTTTPGKELTVAKTVDKQAANPGDKVTFTVTVTNTGQVPLTGADAATFTDDLSNVLDDATYGNDASATIGSATYAEPKLTWTGDLPVGASATVTYSVTVKNPVTGDHQLRNTVSTNVPGNCEPGSTDPKCSTTTPVPGMTIEKKADKQAANPGDKVTYTVTVTNTGKTPLPGARFTDDLSNVVDDATYGNDASATVGSTSYVAPKLTWTGDLPVGATATITYSVTVKNPASGDHKLANVVTSDTPGNNCPPGSTDPKCGTTTPVSGIAIVKTASRTDAKPGDTVTYTVTVTNTGQTALTNATFTDDLTKVLDDAAYGNDASADLGTTTYAAPKLTWTGDLPVGGKATVTYSVTVNNPVAGDHKLTNVVTSNTPGNNCPPGSTDPKCGTTTPVAGLEIVKTSDKANAKPGDKVTYTVTVRNTGQTVQTGATFTDDLSKVLDDAAYNNDAAASAGAASYAAPKLTWTGDLAAGASATVTYSVTVSDPVKGDFKLVNAVTSETPGGNCPPGSTDPKCGTTTPVAGLSIEKKSSPATAKPGDKVTYTVTVKNTGQTVQTGATFTDDLSKVLDDAAYNNDAASSVGTTTYAAPKLSWTGDLPVGASATVTYSVTVSNPVKGDFKLANVVTSDTPGGNCPPGSTDPKCGTTTPVAGLEIVKVADKKDAKPGDKVTYTVTVKNTGQTVQTGATFTDDLSKVVDDATYNNDAASSVGTASYAAPKLTWTGDLPVGATATVTYSVTVNNPVTGDHQLANVVTSETPGGNCPPGSTDPKCGTTTPIAGLEIVKVADKKDAKPGDKVTYTVTVKNTGQTVQTGATFTDDLSRVLDDATFGNDQNASIGSVSYAAPKLTWTGDLPVGATATITYSVTVNNPVKGDHTLANVVTSDTPGNNCPPGSTDPKCGTTTPIAGLEIVKTSDKTDAKPGDKVTYTVSVRNTGQTVQTGATFTDDLSKVLDDATFGNDQNASIGSVSYAAPKLTWTGDLPVGATATVTYSVTVNNPVKGDFKLVNAVTSDTPGGNCPPGSTDPKCGTTTPIAGLEIVKTSDKANAKPGDKVTYTVTVKNTGQTPQNGATFTDDLSKVIDDATFNNDQNASIGSATYAAPKLTWTGDLPVGATATVTYSVTVNNPVTGDHQLANVVTSDTPGNNCPPGSTDPKCGTRTPVSGLEITKVADKANAKPGDKVTYTVTVRNTGQTPQNGATFTDDLSKVVDDATFNNDQNASNGSATYAAPKLTWTGDLPVGATATVTYSVTVNNPVTGDHSLANVVTSDTPGNNCPPGSTDPKCGTTTPVAGLEIVKTSDKANARPGDKVTYTVTVKNTGQTVQTGATFTDDLSKVIDDATFNNDQNASLGSATYAAPKLTWTGDLPVGATATVTYSVTVNNPVKGDFKLVNAVTSDTPGGNCPPGSTDPKCGTTTPIAGLDIAKVADRKDAKPGDKVTYTVTVKNTGQTVLTGATFTDDLSKVIDDAAFNNDQNASIGSATYAAPKLTWTGDLPVGATATVTYSVTVNNPVTGDHSLANVVTSDTPGNNCPPGSTDPKCGTRTPVSGLEITKVADKKDAKPGDKVTYTVTVKNTGQTPQNGATFTDDLSKVIDDATFDNDQNASIGNATYAAPKLTWTGDLPVGATATVTYSVTVNNPVKGDFKLANVVTSDTPGNNCPPGSTDPKCGTTTPLSGLAIEKKADKADAKPGEKVTYTVTVRNTGQTVQTGATFTDDLSKVIDDATFNNDQNASVGSATYAAPKLTWTGDLPVGASATVTYSVTVNDPVKGDHKLANVVTSDTPGNNCPPGSTDPKCGTTTPLPGLALTKKADRTEAKPGDKVTYTITAANTGQTELKGATFTDDMTAVLDDAVYGNDAAADLGTTSYTAPKLTWTGDLPVGATATITYTVTVGDPPTGDLKLGNVVGSTTPGSNCPVPMNARADVAAADPNCSATVLVPRLAIEKKADKADAKPGDTVTYTVTVANTGQTELKGAMFTDDLTGVLGNATYANDAKATTGSAAYAAPKLTWTGDLAVGASATITYSVKVKDVPGGDFTLRNAVGSDTPGSTCPPGSTDPKCGTTTPVAGVAIAKTVGTKLAAAGDVVTYQVTVRNTGKVALKGATFTDDLTGVLGAADYTGDAKATTGAVTYAAPKLTWTGDLPVGSTATVTYSVKVKTPVGADRSLRNAVTSSTPGNNCPTGSTDPKCATTTPLTPTPPTPPTPVPPTPPVTPPTPPKPPLASTGAVIIPVGIAGLLLLAVGGLLLLASRRRRGRR